MKHLFFFVAEADIPEFHLRAMAGRGDCLQAVIRQLRLGKNFLDPVHAAVHHRKAGGLGIQGLDGAEQVEDEEKDAD